MKIGEKINSMKWSIIKKNIYQLKQWGWKLK